MLEFSNYQPVAQKEELPLYTSPTAEKQHILILKQEPSHHHHGKKCHSKRQRKLIKKSLRFLATVLVFFMGFFLGKTVTQLWYLKMHYQHHMEQHNEGQIVNAQPIGMPEVQPAVNHDGAFGIHEIRPAPPQN